jgi:hypothetical protein
MAGIIIEPTAAVLALELPVMLAKNIDAVTETAGKPPRTRPTSFTALSEIPQAFINSPARIKRGTAIKVHESTAAKALWGTTSSGI